MHEATQKATVYYGATQAGTLERRPDGFEFVYHSAYRADPESRPISRQLPLRQPRHRFKALFPLFEAAVPERGIVQSMKTARRLTETDQFALLLHFGTDALGPISVKLA